MELAQALAQDDEPGEAVHRKRGIVPDLVLQKPQSAPARSDRSPRHGMDSDDDSVTTEPPAAVVELAEELAQDDEPEEADVRAAADAMFRCGYTHELQVHLADVAEKIDGDEDLLHDIERFPAYAAQLQATLKSLRARKQKFRMQCLSRERDRIKDLI